MSDTTLRSGFRAASTRLPPGIPSSLPGSAALLLLASGVLIGELLYLKFGVQGRLSPLAIGLPIIGLLAVLLAAALLFAHHRRIVELACGADQLSRAPSIMLPDPDNGVPQDYFPVRADDETGYLARGLNRMLSEYRSAFHGVQTRNAMLHQILGSIDAGVVLTDAVGRIQYVNPAAQRLLGRQTGALIGKSLLEVTLRRDLNSAVEAAALRSEATSASLNLGAAKRHVAARISPFGENHSGSVVVLEDREEITRLESVRRDFIANVSHELRTPLASIRAMAETLASGARDDPAVAGDFLEIIVRESDRLARLTDDILDLARYESGQIHVHIFDLEALLHDVETQISAKAVQANLAFRCEVAALPPCCGDPSALRQVFLNILDNAVKYTRSGSITLTGRVSDAGERFSSGRPDDEELQQYVRVDVTDTGPGIRAEHLSRIFERFYRVDKARSREQGGTGLGLSIVKHVVEAHAGRVEVASRPGEGTTFTVWLPAGRSGTDLNA